MPKTTFQRAMPPSADLAHELEARLAEAGQTLTEAELAPFLFYLTDEHGAMTAGCKGEIAFKSARVAELWVDPTLRGQGIGRALLEEAEAHARARRCIRIHIETRNEKARALYEACGYRVFGQLPRYEGENTYYYLEKRLE